MWFSFTKEKTQKDIVLDMLKKSDRKPYEFTDKGIMSYTKIISRLRDDGWVVECKKELVRHKNGKIYQMYTTYSLLGELEIFTINS